MDSLTPRHSGISTDVLLFTDIGLSLVHHYRVHKRGLPHLAFRLNYLAFRRNYLSQPRALLPLPMVLPTSGGVAQHSLLEFAVCGGISRRCGCLASTIQRRDQVPAASPDHGVACAERSAPHGAGPAGCGEGSGARLLPPVCCRCRWILVVWTCRRFGLRQCPPRLGSFLPNMSSCSGGGGGGGGRFA